MHTDIEKIEHLISMAQELILPSQQPQWEIRGGDQQQGELMLAAKGDIIRSIDKLTKVKGLYPVS